MIDLVNTTGLTENEARDLYVADGDAWKKLRKAFRIASARLIKKAPGSEAAKNRASEFKIKASELDVQVSARKKKDLNAAEIMTPSDMNDIEFGVMTDVDVDAYGEKQLFDIETEPDSEALPDMDAAEVMTPSDMNDIEFGVMTDLDVDAYGEEQIFNVEPQPEPEAFPEAECEEVGIQQDIPVDEEGPIELGVEMDLAVDEEFKGGDEIGLNEPRLFDELEVDPTSEMDV